jgi:hypothetical protein
VRKQYQTIAAVPLAYWTLQYLNKRCDFLSHPSTNSCRPTYHLMQCAQSTSRDA